jgi:hypothetical protein
MTIARQYRGRPPMDDLRLEVIDYAEHADRLTAGEAMLAALAREHPERVTVSQPHGTKAPRRLERPTESGLKTNFEP